MRESCTQGLHRIFESKFKDFSRPFQVNNDKLQGSIDNWIFNFNQYKNIHCNVLLIELQ